MKRKKEPRFPLIERLAFGADQDVVGYSIWVPFDAGGVPDTRRYDTFYDTVFRMIRP